MTRLLNYLIEAIRSPREQLSRGQQFLRKSLELVVYCYRQLQRQRADGMAAELTYRTIFALIPVVVLGLVMFRVVGGLEDVQAKVENQLFSFFGVPDVTDGYEPLQPITSTAPTLQATPPAELIPNTVEPPAADSSRTETPDLTEAPDLTETPDLTATPDLREGQDKIDAQDRAEAQRTSDADTILASPRENTSPPAIRNPALQSPPTVPQDPDEPSVRTVQAASGQLSADSKEPSLGTADDSQSASENTTEDDAAQQARISIRRTLHDLADKVSSVDFASIGVFGLLLFTYAAVALANAAEHLFNRIYEAPSKRPVHLRLAIHWSILTLGGGLLAMSLYLSGQLVEWFGNMEGRETLKPILTHIVSLLASWILLFLVYALMPNTRVSVRAAAIGSAVSAVLWELAKYGFQIYLSEAVPYSLYGSLGLIPLFLFWIYLTWLLVLFGLILTYTLQALGGHLPDQFDKEGENTVDGDPDWMLPIMCEVGSSFAEGIVLDHQALSSRIGLSSRTVHELVPHLIDAELLREVSTNDENAGLTLARPADKITIVEILDLAEKIRPPHRHAAWKTFSSLKQAERKAADGKTLADA